MDTGRWTSRALGWAGGRRRAPDERRRIAAVALLATLGVALGVAIVVTQTGSETGLLDLRIYLGAARELAHGGSPYDHRAPVFGLGSTYPPLWSVLVLPVTTLPVAAVELGWTLANLSLWARILWVLAGGRARPPHVGTAALTSLWFVTLLSAPVWNTLNQGQVNLLLWALVTADLDRVVRRRRAGVGLGLAAAIKLTPALAIALLAAARRPATALVAAATAVAATALTWLVVPGPSAVYWTGLVLDTGRVGPIGDAQSASLAALSARFDPTGGAPTRLVVAAAVVAVVVLAARTVRRALDAGAVITAATAIGCAMALVSPIAWTHHLVFLCFPALLLLGRGDRRRHLALALVTLALVDPLGWGRSAATSTARTIAMAGLLVAGDRLLAAERRWRGTDPPVRPPPE